MRAEQVRLRSVVAQMRTAWSTSMRPAPAPGQPEQREEGLLARPPSLPSVLPPGLVALVVEQVVSDLEGEAESRA